MTDGPPDAEVDAANQALLSVYLAKYGSLRQELFQRFQFQGQAFNFLILVLTALIASAPHSWGRAAGTA